MLLKSDKKKLFFFSRHKADRKTNKANTQLFTEKFETIHWEHIDVGDIIKVKGDQFFPADLVLISSSEPEGICTIETSNLDGETNLKIKSALALTKDYNTEDSLKDFKAEVKYEQPNRKLYEFNGNLKGKYP